MQIIGSALELLLLISEDGAEAEASVWLTAIRVILIHTDHETKNHGLVL